MLERLYAELGSVFGQDKLLRSVPMAEYTTMKVGGSADLMAFSQNEEQVVRAIEVCRDNDVPFMLMGKGSNLIVKDGGIRGLVIVVASDYAKVCVEGDTIVAQAGATLADVSDAAQAEGLTGLEFATGIPGTVGGGVVMNAGAYDGQISDCLAWARVFLDGKVQVLSCDQMQYGYRTSVVLEHKGVVLEAGFELQRGDKEGIRRKMDELNARRADKQPLEMPSAGSVFKRPTGYFAGTLIDQSGLKGYTIGGAQVSKKHAGFIVNTGNATAADVLALIEHIQKTVKDLHGVTLETEVRILGESL